MSESDSMVPPAKADPVSGSEASIAPEGDALKLADLVEDRLASAAFSALDELAGELTETHLERAEAYWRARANDIFVRNRPEIIQQLAQVDATNLQTVILGRILAEMKASKKA